MSELARWLREEAADWEPTGEDYEAGYRSPTAEKLREAANVVERCEQAEADRDRLAARVRELEGALREIMKKEGPFSKDPLQHCSNTVDNMADIANDALSGEWQQDSGHDPR